MSGVPMPAITVSVVQDAHNWPLNLTLIYAHYNKPKGFLGRLASLQATALPIGDW